MCMCAAWVWVYTYNKKRLHVPCECACLFVYVCEQAPETVSLRSSRSCAVARVCIREMELDECVKENEGTVSESDRCASSRELGGNQRAATPDRQAHLQDEIRKH